MPLTVYPLSDSVQTRQAKLKPVRHFATTTSAPLSWDVYSKETQEISKKVKAVTIHGDGQLERVVADEIVGKMMALKRRFPERRGSVLDTSEVSHDIDDTASADFEKPPAKDPTIERYEYLFVLALNARDPRLVLELLDEVLQRDLNISSVMLNVAMQSSLRDLEPKRALSILKQVQDRVGESPMDALTYTNMIEAYTALGDMKGMSETYQKFGIKAANENLRIDAVAKGVAAYITGLVKIGYTNLAIRVFEDVRSKEPNLVNIPSVKLAMIEAYSDARQHTLVTALFDEFVAISSSVSFTTLARTIVSYLKLKKVQEAEMLYASAVKSNLQIQAWDKLQEIANSKEGGYPRLTPSSEDRTLLEKAEEQESNHLALEAAICHFAASGDLVLADELFRRYLQLLKRTQKPVSSNPTVQVISALFQGAARLGNAQYLDLIHKFPSVEPPPSLVRALTLFHIRRNNPDAASDSFFKILTRYPNAVDSTICEQVLAAFVTGPKKKLRDGAKFYHTLLEQTQLSNHLTTNFFNHAITLFTKLEEPTHVSETLAELKKRQLTPNTGTYNCLMQLYLIKPDYQMVLNTYTSILQRGLVPNLETMLALTVALGESKALSHTKTVSFLREQFEKYHISPSIELFDLLRRATVVAGNPGAFGVLLKTFSQKYKTTITPMNYISWMTALLDCNQLEQALDLAQTVYVDSRADPSILTHGFCSLLALFLTKEAGSDISVESIDRWVCEPALVEVALSVQEAERFAKDLKSWRDAYGRNKPSAK